MGCCCTGRGQSLAEVGLVVGLLSVMSILALSTGGTTLQGFYQTVSQSLATSSQSSFQPGLLNNTGSVGNTAIPNSSASVATVGNEAVNSFASAPLSAPLSSEAMVQSAAGGGSLPQAGAQSSAQSAAQSPTSDGTDVSAGNGGSSELQTNKKPPSADDLKKLLEKKPSGSTAGPLMG